MILKKLRYSCSHRFLRSVILFVIAISLSIATAQPSAAQFALPSAGGSGSITVPPPEVIRFGSMETISVESPLSNRDLFTIASPTVHDRNPTALAGQLPVEQRAKEIQAKLLLLLQRDIDPESLMFGVSQLNNVTIITVRDDQRRQIRVNTIAGAIKGLSTIVIALVGGLLALSQLGVPTASVVAIGSLAGLVITFGSQNLVKDLVNGFFILAEDQYAVGDVIDVGTAAGLVEDLNMRVMQIRSSDGELITVPNSAITQQQWAVGRNTVRIN